MNATIMQLPFIHTKNELPRIRISNTDFFIDGIRRQFRDTNNPHNTIPFGKLKYDETQGGYEILFDKLTRNKYEGYIPQGGIPPMTERVFIPRFKEMEQVPTPEKQLAPMPKIDLQEIQKNNKQRSRKGHGI